ncbi:TPA: hypothetical protein WI684_000962 [Neisseria meningitidis]
MNIINYTGDDIIISLTREELQLLRSLVIEIYAGVYIDAEEFEIVSGIRNPQLVQELEQHLIEAYNLMNTTG